MIFGDQRTCVPNVAWNKESNTMGNVHVHDSSGGSSSEDGLEEMRTMMGPMGPDQQIRAAIHTCWMMLPTRKRNPAEIRTHIERLVERALQNLEEDAQAFGL